MNILTVIPLQKTNYKEELTYFSAQNVSIGSIVSISLGNRKMLGLVVSSVDASESKSEVKAMGFNLKKITEIKEQSIFRTEFIQSVLCASDYFVIHKSSLFAHLIPSALKENYDTVAGLVTKNEELKDRESTSTRTMKVEKLLFQAPLSERISYYKTLIRTSFANKKSVYITLPREHDFLVFENELKRGIEDFVITLHGGLSPKKTQERIEKILTMEHPVLIIGTTLFLSVPRKDIETIILEHESATAYKTFVEPYFDQRTFVEIFAGMINSKLIMSDSLLRFETIGRLVTDGIHELNTLSYRVSFNGEIDIIEKNKKSNEVTRDGRIPKFKVVSDECAEEIRGATDHTQNVFVFALRKGLATLTICNSCASTICCDACGHPVVLYESKTSNKRMFVCNVCKTEKDPDTRCAYCSGWDLVPIGIGTDTVYEELKRRFPNTEIMKLDKEVAKNTKQAEEIISKFENTKGSILVGTEMALLYMKEQVALSVVASFDSLWSIPNYKISEKVLQIVLSLVEKTEDKIIIETKNTTNKAIQAIRSMHLASFIREELREREVFGYPPYRRFIKISVTGNKRETSIHKKILSDLFKDYEPHLFGGRNKTQKDEYTTHCLLKLKTSLWSVSQLSPFGEIDEGLKAKLKGLPKPFNITVDPEDFL